MTDTTILTAPTRPRNAAATRAAILESARARFLVESFDQVGVRQIAGDVGVDAALICRYFGSKEELFAEVVATTCDDPMEVLAGDRSTFGSRVAKAMLDPEQRSHRESVDFINLAVRSTMSAAAGERVLLPQVRKAPPQTAILADGFSCREQINQLGHRHALHFAEVLARTCGCGG